MAEEETHWRRRFAREYARPWAHDLKVVWSAAFTGLGGGIVTAVTTALPWWGAVLIGIAGAVVGTLSPWTAMYFFGAATASGRVLRRDLAEIRRLVEAQPVAAVVNPPTLFKVAALEIAAELRIVQAALLSCKTGGGVPPPAFSLTKWGLYSSNLARDAGLHSTVATVVAALQVANSKFDLGGYAPKLIPMPEVDTMWSHVVDAIQALTQAASDAET